MDPFILAQRYIGIAELSEQGKDHPLIQWWLSLCGFSTETPDEVPWCSAFVNGIAWELRLPRSKSAAARSWLTVGIPILRLEDAVPGDIVVLSRPPNPAQGHVGFFAGFKDFTVQLLGGNQANGVSISAFSAARVIGIRRIT